VKPSDIQRVTSPSETPMNGTAASRTMETKSSGYENLRKVETFIRETTSMSATPDTAKIIWRTKK